MSDFYHIYNTRRCPAEKAGHSIKEEYQFYFKSTKSNLTYCIEAVYHKANFFAVKYYCKAHKNSKNRYSLLTNTHEPYKILRSCIQIIPILQEKYPSSSFVAVGARSISSGKIEEPENTIRFQLYYKMIFNLFSQYPGFLLTRIPEVSGIGIICVKDILEHTTEFARKKLLITRTNSIREVVLECYDDIHIPD